MRTLLSSITFALVSAGMCPAAIVMTPAVPYRSVLDSPYVDQHLAGSAFLEDFESLDHGDQIIFGPGGEEKETPLPGQGGEEYFCGWR